MDIANEYVVTLLTLNQGAAVELFDLELAKVLANIADPNTDADAIREIAIKVRMKPDEDRRQAITVVEASSKLAKPKHAKTTVYFGKVDGKEVAVERDPTQGGLFDRITTGANTVQFQAKGDSR